MPSLDTEQFTQQTAPNSNAVYLYRKADNNALAAVARFNTSTGVLGTIGQYMYDASGNLVAYVADGNVFTLQSPSLYFDVGTAAPTISQSTKLTDAAVADLTIRSQAPLATASTNKSSGSVIIVTPAPVSGGAAGTVSIKPGAVTALEVSGTQLFVANTTGAPAGVPTGGGYLYVEAGALKYKGSSATVTTIAAA